MADMDDDMDDDMDLGGSVEFGEPAAASEADRSIAIDASDSFRFSPSSVAAAADEVITFVVKNKGALDHEFVLGDAATQDEHEEMMASGDAMMHDDPNAIMVPAGQSVELTWRFGGGGEVLFGCHVAGHYNAGMKGTIEVSS